MSTVALSQGSASLKWTPERLHTEQYEWGVLVNPDAKQVSHLGRVIQGWINERRSRGFGSAMPLNILLVLTSARLYGAVRPRHRRRAQGWSDSLLCQILNSPRSGLVVTPTRQRRCCHR